MKILTLSYHVLGAALQITMALTFIVAYINPSKKVTVWIDVFGEADFELLIIILFLFLMLRFWVILFLSFMRWIRKRIDECEIEKAIQEKYP